MENILFVFLLEKQDSNALCGFNYLHVGCKSVVTESSLEIIYIINLWGSYVRQCCFKLLRYEMNNERNFSGDLSEKKKHLFKLEKETERA